MDTTIRIMREAKQKKTKAGKDAVLFCGLHLHRFVPPLAYSVSGSITGEVDQEFGQQNFAGSDNCAVTEAHFLSSPLLQYTSSTIQLFFVGFFFLDLNLSSSDVNL